MGVKGLTTYVNSNREQLLRYHLLHDTNLVIDGHSLCHQLYHGAAKSKCRSASGGDYDRYAACVTNFFGHLKKCNVSCYVLFDGSFETRKLEKACSRIKDKIRAAASNSTIFPLFLKEVLKQILAEMEIPYTVCVFEADDEIAAMARHLNCPVLSQDSDFFIYNVIYIPFDTIKYRKPKDHKLNGDTFCALECQIFMATHLTELYRGLKEEMLPLFATLLGNDYVRKLTFKDFLLCHFQLQKGKISNEKEIHTLLQWLQNENLDTAIDKVMSSVKECEKKRISKILITSIEGYKRTYCQSLKYFNISQDETGNRQCLINVKELLANARSHNDSTEEIHDDGNGAYGSSSHSSDSLSEKHVEHKIQEKLKTELPEWFCNRVRRNIIPLRYIDLRTLQIYFLKPQSEDYTDEDASLSTVSFLRYAFDILTDYSQESLVFYSRDNKRHLKQILLGPEHSISRPVEKSYGELNIQELRVYFKHFVEVKFPSLDMALIESLPPDFQLVMLSILWWVANCSVPKAFIHSLFISYVMLNVVDEKIGSFRVAKQFNSKFAAELRELRKIPCRINKDEEILDTNKVTYEDSLIAASALLQHFERPGTYESKRMHKFAEFQCILQQFLCLNSLSGNPHIEIVVSKFFNGTFAYNIAYLLEMQTDPIAFMDRKLIGADTVLLFYKSLCRVYEQCAEQLALSTSDSMFVKMRKKIDPKILAKLFESIKT